MTDFRNLFVRIVAYRDAECAPTVDDLFTRAEEPERISVGIVWQARPEDGECVWSKPYCDRVRVLQIPAEESRGTCWARHRSHELWQGEPFSLQIDSHMRFEPGWDRLLREQYEATGVSRAVLSKLPAGYEPPDQRSPWLTRMVAKEFNIDGLLTFDSLVIQPADGRRPQPTAFLAACFVFGPSSMFVEVPYDPYLYFLGEEASWAARLWTSGWDLFSPGRVILYHRYRGKEDRMLHWNDHPDWRQLDARSTRRVKTLLGTDRTFNPDDRLELDRYGLGTARSLAQYEAFSGIDYRMRTVSDEARWGRVQEACLGCPQADCCHHHGEG